MNAPADLRLATAARYGPELAFNLGANLRARLAAPGLSCLQGALAGRTVVCAGAGPSLDEALPLLREANLPVIACDMALPCLRAAGVHVTAVVSLDVIAAKAACLSSRPLLVTTPLAHPALRRAGAGPVLFAGTALPPLAGLAEPILGEPEKVAHLAVALACRLGAARIVLAGVAFALGPDVRAYARGAVLAPQHVARYEAPPPGFVRVLANSGERIWSWPNMPAYAAGFARALAGFTGQAVNSSSRGAVIPGFPYQPLEVFCQAVGGPVHLVARGGAGCDARPVLEELQAQAQAALAACRSVATAAEVARHDPRAALPAPPQGPVVAALRALQPQIEQHAADLPPTGREAAIVARALPWVALPRLLEPFLRGLEEALG
ncbi:MAG: DUF115 domain-containing protein [Planctomycetes bacterium]|nr:DUF115 domain-containing protein [Planctomycetota bacterium]